MSRLPLGGYRRTRKRLVRCAHRGLTITYDETKDRVRADCRLCRGVAYVTREACLDMSAPAYAVLEAVFPKRVARKVSDGPAGTYLRNITP